MDKLIKPARMAALVGFMVVMIIIIMVSLYRLQIIEGAEYYAASQNTTTQTVTVAAARGNILDRYGRVLVSNKSCNNLIFNTDELFEQDDPNAVILQLAQAVEDSGGKYTDTLPITTSPPFEYVENITDLQKTRLDAYLNANDLPLSTTAVELMAYFRTAFKIDNNYSADEMRTIAGIRYEIKIRYVINTSDYIFAEDVSMDLITQLLENGVPGFTVQSAYIREYNTKYAAHLLGNVGLMDETEIETYQDYSLNAVVGKTGAELAFEKYLHGTDGLAQITSTKGGTVINTTYKKEPVPGNNVTLTIDIGMQEAAENALNSYITAENATRETQNATLEAQGLSDETKDLITGGAVAAVNIKTGEPLVLASWPTFDLSTYIEDFEELNEDENAPMFNRALSGTYAPGSTFKPCSALASLCEGIISTGYTYYCSGVFDKYAGDEGQYAPHCWIYPSGHGELNVTGAIQNSCNVFFYNCGDLLGIDKLSDYAMRLGLGVHTGIELPEETGVMPTQKYKLETFNQEWYQGDSMQAAIGQSFSLFTPLQLANYIATIANNGTRYEATILKSVRTLDYSESVFEREPVIAEQIDAEQEYYDAIRQGMYEAANSSIGTGFATFGGYRIKVATKTGTSQLGEGITNNAIFVCYAPFDDPEIAISVVVEHGAAGANVGPIAREVLDYYLSFKSSTTSLEVENTLLK